MANISQIFSTVNKNTENENLEKATTTTTSGGRYTVARTDTNE
jgi:DNA gyrase inhibitor GyrI